MAKKTDAELKPGESVKISTENLPHGGYINIALHIVSSPVRIAGTVLLGSLALLFSIFIYPGNERLQNVLLSRFEEKPSRPATPAPVSPATPLPTAPLPSAVAAPPAPSPLATSAPLAPATAPAVNSTPAASAAAVAVPATSTPQVALVPTVAQTAAEPQPPNPGRVAFAQPQRFAPETAFWLSTNFKGPSMVAQWIKSGELANWVRLSEKTGEPTQAWTLEPAGDDFYRVKSKATDSVSCFDLDARRDHVEVHNCNEAPSQLWRVGRGPTGSRLFNRASGPDFCVDVLPSNSALVMRRCVTVSGQAWQIDAVK